MIIAARRRGMGATRHCRRSTWISAHLSCWAWWSSPRFLGGLSIQVIARPNSSQICYMELQWWLCPIKGNYGLPEHSEVSRYCLGGVSYPQNAARQMALRGFAKCLNHTVKARALIKWSCQTILNKAQSWHGENMSKVKLFQLRLTSQGYWSNFSSTPIWLGYPQLCCY